MLNRRLQAKLSNVRGDIAQILTARRLSAMGVPFLQRIHNGWVIHRAQGAIIGAHPCERVAGDFWGILEDARPLLVEVKERPEVLAWNDLEVHQHAALATVRARGRVSLISWSIGGGQPMIFDYPVPGWAKGSPIHPGQARELDAGCSLMIKRV